MGSKKSNKNLRIASKNKNDEFYTFIEDIEVEIKMYKDQFRDKIVYCNCDNPRLSNFSLFFRKNFDNLGLDKLIVTGIDGGGLIVEGGVEHFFEMESGDFRSKESKEYLSEADIVCTNPPFSLFREYVAQLIEYDKEFLIIGNFNAVTYKEIFSLIKEDKIWLGYSPRSMNFQLPSGEFKEVNACWFTNMEVAKRLDVLPLCKHYKGNEDKYPRYDNYNAINVDRVKDIPKDYYGYMGVPITFLNKYNPNQFKILGIMNTGEENYGIRLPNTPHGRPVVNGKEKYLRYIVQRKD